MRCPRCQNEDYFYFYQGSKGWMCRRCVMFKRKLIEEDTVVEIERRCGSHEAEYHLAYPLTEKQKEISFYCAKASQKQDVFIEAICGAGKTELVILSIAAALRDGKTVGFAIARRQVVLELQKRLSAIFKQAKVIAVCQGYTSDVTGDLIICTTHQLYRYPHCFDLLVLDEPDAFPYKNNEVLQGIVKSSCRGQLIYLTATADEYLKQRVQEKSIVHLKLSRRPHQQDLIVPVKKSGPILLLGVWLWKWIRDHPDSQLLVFVPTIALVKYLKWWVSLKTTCLGCHSKTENRDEVIEQFRNKEIRCLVATTILERGITIDGVQVCVWLANHRVFDKASLIQMSGRVGRSFKSPFGDCLFLCSSQSEVVQQCIRYCREANEK
ncbi:MAG: helicase-related protein [Anaerorhabdus sp.]